MNHNTFEAIPFTHLETVAGGRGAIKKPATAQPAQPAFPGNVFQGCLTGAAGGLLGGVHGAALGCAVGAGKSLLDGLSKQLTSQLGGPTAK